MDHTPNRFTNLYLGKYVNYLARESLTSQAFVFNDRYAIVLSRFVDRQLLRYEFM